MTIMTSGVSTVKASGLNVCAPYPDDKDSLLSRFQSNHRSICSYDILKLWSMLNAQEKNELIAFVEKKGNAHEVISWTTSVLFDDPRGSVFNHLDKEDNRKAGIDLIQRLYHVAYPAS